jgi:predicted phosphodiesterase
VDGGGLVINARDDVLVVADRLADAGRALPTRALTVSAWVAIERTQRWGGIVSCVQDNGEAEKGVVLGYEDERFSFALATTGADDGDGRLTYLRGVTPLVPGRWHHVAATFDGSVMRLYVDGTLEAESREQSGAILYDPSAPFVLGSYRDANEDFPLDGRLLAARIASEAWSAARVRAAFEQRRELAALEPWTDLEFGFLVPPYLTWPAETAMTVLFETTFPATAEVRYRRDTESDDEAATFRSSEAARLHECRLEGLEPDQKYFYRVVAAGSGDDAVDSGLLSFRTACSKGKPFTFVVIGDTQTHEDVAKRVSDLAWMHRPNLVLHAGDLVDTGTNKRDWTDVFFPSMQPLVSRVPMMPVLGNHEQDAEHYYRYMSLPEPERWYSFRYGDAEFFMIDGNRSLADQSAQLAWLESALRTSEAMWRFAVLHQPPYTSDSNDYGDTFETSSFRGDANVRNIVELLEEHDVDICFSGHVHDYERTFPIRDQRVTEYEDGGVIYVTAAGGGGSLEDFDPTNTWFGHKKARYHHLVYVGIHGDQLEFQAIDEYGRLFDTLALTKRP